MSQALTLDEVQVAPEDAAQLIYDLRREVSRLRSIVEFAGARDFLVATVAEAGYQRVLWGNGPDAAPTAWGSNADMDWVGLIAALAGKAAGTDPANIDKKLHRITTCAAAAANWHQRVKESGINEH